MQPRTTLLLLTAFIVGYASVQAQELRLFQPVNLPDNPQIQIAGVFGDQALLFSPSATVNSKPAFYSFSRDGKLLGRTQPIIPECSTGSVFLFWQQENTLHMLLQSEGALHSLSFDKSGNLLQSSILDTKDARLYHIALNGGQEPAALYRFSKDPSGYYLILEYRMLDEKGNPGPLQSETSSLSYDRCVPGEALYHPDGNLYYTVTRPPATMADSSQTFLFRTNAGSNTSQRVMKVAEAGFLMDLPVLNVLPNNNRLLLSAVYYGRSTRKAMGIRTVQVDLKQQIPHPEIQWYPFAETNSSGSIKSPYPPVLNTVLRSVYFPEGKSEPVFLFDADPLAGKTTGRYASTTVSNAVTVSNLTPSAELEMLRIHNQSVVNSIDPSNSITNVNRSPVIAPLPAGFGGGGAYSPLLDNAYTPPSAQQSASFNGNAGQERRKLTVQQFRLQGSIISSAQTTTIAFSSEAVPLFWKLKNGALYLDLGAPARLLLLREGKAPQTIKLNPGLNSRFVHFFLEKVSGQERIWALSRSVEGQLSLGYLQW